MENVFKAAVVVFVAAAAAFYYFGSIDGVFVSVVLACLSFFLSVRVRVKGRLAERERERQMKLMASPGEEPDFYTSGEPGERKEQV